MPERLLGRRRDDHLGAGAGTIPVAEPNDDPNVSLIGAPHANLLLLNLTLDSMVKKQGWRAMDEDD